MNHNCSCTKIWSHHSFHAPVHHHLQAWAQPFHTMNRNLKQSINLFPHKMKAGLSASCWVVDRCYCMTNIADYSDADLPVQFVFNLRRVLSEICSSVQQHRPPLVLGAGPTAPDVGWNDGEKPEGELCTIWGTVMWAMWGTQHMNAACPVSLLARSTSNGFKAWRQKIETKRERDNCQSSIFDLFDLNVLKYCFCLQ